jgi:hypothetical protein
MSVLSRVLAALPGVLRDLDSWVRHLEFAANRTEGGVLQSWVGIRRHTVPALALPTLLRGYGTLPVTTGYT